MFLIALRNLLQEKGRLLISVLGVAFSVVLIITMFGIYNGVIAQFTQFITKNPTDLVVSTKGVQDFYHGSSLIPETLVEQLGAEPGVRDAVPMISQRGEVSGKGEDMLHVFIAGYDPAKPQGAPWEVDGIARTDISSNEVIVSSALAQNAGKGVGDAIRLGGTDLVIAGLVSGASSLGTHTIWVSLETARQLTQLTGVVNFIYLTLDNPAEAQAAADRLGVAYPDFAVVTKETFVKNGEKEIEGSFLPIVRAVAVIALVIGVAVIGLTIYTATVDKAKEYGILKAIGLNGNQLFRVVLAQAVLISAAGLAIGIVGAAGLAMVLEELINVRPVVSVATVYVISVVSIGMGLLASFLPIRRINSIDPAEVFKQ